VCFAIAVERAAAQTLEFVHNPADVRAGSIGPG
jgi:hypothetical protein